MSEKIVVRKAVEQDMNDLIDMIARQKTLNEELDPNFRIIEDLSSRTKEYLEKLMKNDDAVILVAINSEENKPIGVIIGQVVDRVFYKPRYKMIITDFYIKPLYRRMRIGSLLLEKIIAEAEKKGAGIITAIYPSNNKIAEEFYEKHGFKILQVERYRNV